MQTADQRFALGGNISGLAFADPTRLFAVRDGPGELLQLDRSADGWTMSAGWGKGRALRYADGSGSPDAEAVAVVPGEGAVAYVGAERDNDKTNASRNSIMRYDTSGTGPLRATQQWELDTVLPTSRANAGIEGLTWIPDEVLVSTRLRDETGEIYAPADHPSHGAGLFVVALEQTGSLHFVALRDDGEIALVASMASGLDALMEVTWHAERRELWALCDNTCGGRAAVFAPGPDGFALVAIVAPPDGMSSLNNEGFAMTARCVEGAMLAVWSDDGASDNHVLREAGIPCAAIASSAVAGPAPPPPPATRQPAAGESHDDRRGSGAAWVSGALAIVILALAATVIIRRRGRAAGTAPSDR